MTVKRNYGFDNEWDFFNYLNGKKVGEVNLMFRKFLLANFPYINNDMKITAYVNFDRTKEDIWIKVGKVKKSISIKMGKCNTVHNEYIYNFTKFLEQEKVPTKIIDIILDYFFADGTTNGTGKRTLTFPDYKLKLKRKIRKVNKYFMKHEDLLIKLINRFVIGSTDILIHGTVDNFTYITKDEIIKLLLSLKKEPSSTIHFSRLIFASKGRNNDIDKFIVQIKWYNLEDDIARIRKNLPV